MARWTGFFGKMPATGDFVARGLPQGLRLPLDRWLTDCLAAAAPEDWPPDGLRARVGLGGMTVLIAAVPSEDKLGRLYPLVAVLRGDNVPVAAGNAWCDAVIYDLADAADGLIGAEDLTRRLAEAPEPGAGAVETADVVWRTGRPPAPATRAGVEALLSSG